MLYLTEGRTTFHPNIKVGSHPLPRPLHIWLSIARLNDGLDQLREIVGSADQSGLSDATIQDFLWNCEFDIEEATQWALGAWKTLINI
jgi:hypothetical protein